MHFLKYLLLPLTGIAILSWISEFRTPQPASLNQALYFSPLHLAAAALDGDPAARELIPQVKINRKGVFQRPALAAVVGLETLIAVGLLVPLLRKSRA